MLSKEGDISPVLKAFRGPCVTSRLTELELRAAIFQRWRAGVEDVAGRDLLLAAVQHEIVPTLTFLSLNRSVVREGTDIVAVHPVRSLDAIHLATAVIAVRHARRHSAKLSFCTADRRQADAAKILLGTSQVTLLPPSS
jgi:predicted nucleic acid-binding protein